MGVDILLTLSKYENFNEMSNPTCNKNIWAYTRIPRKASSHLLAQKSQEPQSECGY